MGHPTIYPTGSTIYDKEKAYSGYTIFPSIKGALLIDMNGNEVQLWEGLQGFPNKILPGGFVLGSTGERNPRYSYQDQKDLVQVDFEGNIVWRFDKTEEIEDPGEEKYFCARQHHDFQREGSGTGYYSPEEEPLTDRGNTILLVHEDVHRPEISDKRLLDDKIIEVNWEGEIIWEWKASDHFEEFGFDEDAKKALYADPNYKEYKDGSGSGDWMHINSLSVLGPNKWYDKGDERFHPDNLIWDARNSNILAIISKKTGKVVWKLGPNFDDSEETKKLQWIIGQHHLHMIPRGLPGEGNLLVFDNGGWGGYGLGNPGCESGINNAIRDTSRVLEIDPISLDIVWQYTSDEAGHLRFDAYKFYSPYISSAQRLPNGNTLITEGSDGRLIEVTKDHEIVWEYINPYYKNLKNHRLNMVYRAYRVPYEWVPQLEKPEEISIEPVDVSTFRVQNASPGEGTGRITSVEGVDPKIKKVTGMGEEEEEEVLNFCVASFDEK